MDNEMTKIIEGFKDLDTTCVSDALDSLGLRGGCFGIHPIVARTTAVGPAFTVRYVPCGPVKGTVGDFLDDVKPGQVVVLDNAGRLDCTVWGDIMTYYCQKLGIAGTVIDGVCRDIPRMLDYKYPMYTRSRFMVTGRGRVEVAAINEPVSIGGVKVCPDDIMICDDTGVVAVPAEWAAEVLETAQEVDRIEQGIMDELEAGGGETLKDIRQRTSYHWIQEKKDK